MELLHVLLLGMIDIGKVLSSNDQVIDVYYDEYLSSRVARDEQGIIELGHSKADLMKILSYLQMPCSRCLLEAIERFLELAYRLWVCVRLEIGRLYDVHLI